MTGSIPDQFGWIWFISDQYNLFEFSDIQWNS